MHGFWFWFVASILGIIALWLLIGLITVIVVMFRMGGWIFDQQKALPTRAIRTLIWVCFVGGVIVAGPIIPVGCFFRTLRAKRAACVLGPRVQ